MYLIAQFKPEAIPFIKQQLGLTSEKAWTEPAIKAELYHFAYFTKRLLGHTYIQQQHLAKAKIVFEALINAEHYMDRPEDSTVSSS